MSCRRQDRSSPPFSIYNTLFLINGIDLHDDSVDESVFERRLRFFKRAFFATLCLMVLIDNIVRYPVRSGSRILVKFGLVLQSMRLLMQIQMTINMCEINTFISQLCRDLNGRERRFLSRVSLFIFITTFGGFLLLVSVLLLANTGTEVPRLSPEYFISTMLTSVLNFSMPFQCLSLILLYIHHKKRIALLHRLARRGRADVMFNVACEMKTVSNTFDRLFSLHPLTWLLYNFGITTYTLVFILSDLMDIRTLTLITLFYQNVAAALFIIFIVWVKEQISGHRSTIYFTYLMSSLGGHREMCPSLSFALHEAFACNFTLCGVFNIDRNLIFSYLSSVLTFSVLVIQLQYGTLIPKTVV